jgi:hypothetical protein
MALVPILALGGVGIDLGIPVPVPALGLLDPLQRDAGGQGDADDACVPHQPPRTPVGEGVAYGMLVPFDDPKDHYKLPVVSGRTYTVRMDPQGGLPVEALEGRYLPVPNYDLQLLNHRCGSLGVVTPQPGNRVETGTFVASGCNPVDCYVVVAVVVPSRLVVAAPLAQGQGPGAAAEGLDGPAGCEPWCMLSYELTVR